MRNIETGRLIIREFAMEDANDLHDILGDDETMRYCEPAYDMAKTRDFLQTFCIGRKAALAAVEKQRRKVIGYILFNEAVAGVYEMGWFFNRNFWRQGYAYEACRAVIDFAFRELGAHKIFAETIDAAASVGLMKKLGMTLEGVQRSQTRDSNGNWGDVYLYGLIRDEWENRS